MNEQELSDNLAQTRFSSSPTAPLEIMQKKWFCMGLEKSGKTFRQDSESANNFLDIANKSMVAWIDYITDDPMKDLPVVAAQMGFSEGFISNLSCCDQLNYQDFDNEMWLSFPSIQIRGNKVTAYPLIVLIRKNVVFTIHVRVLRRLKGREVGGAQRQTEPPCS